jgi:peptidoglycan/LPS O-acetylase OafA/YrhL
MLSSEVAPVRTTGPAHRLASLDALRGAAAVYVMVYHYTEVFDNYYGQQPAIPFWVRYGGMPVYLFFMVSGFVIFMTLEKTRTWQDFAVARFARLFPAYWTCMLLTFAATHALGLPGRTYGLKELLVGTTMLQRFFGVEPIDTVYWSLTVEILFYAAMMGLFLTGLLKHIQWVLVGWVALSIAFPEVHGDEARDIVFAVKKVGILWFIPWFAAGITIFRWWKAKAPDIAGAIIFALWPVSVWLNEEPKHKVVALACVGLFSLIFYGVLKGWGRPIGMETRAAVYLGRLSYSLYLIHDFLGYAVMLQLKSRGFGWRVYIPVAICVSVLLSMAVHHLVEQPALDAIRGWWKRRQAQKNRATVEGSPA